MSANLPMRWNPSIPEGHNEAAEAEYEEVCARERASFLNTEGLCHEACADDCNECVRALEQHRSEAVGAEFEPETPPRSLRSRIFWGVVDAAGIASAVGVVLGLFMLAAHWDEATYKVAASATSISVSPSDVGASGASRGGQ